MSAKERGLPASGDRCGTRTRAPCSRSGVVVDAFRTSLVLVLVVFPCDIIGASLRRSDGDSDVSGREKRQIIGDNVHNYLMNFGYLPQSDFETGNLRTDEQLQDALRNLQSFAKLPVTGKLDEATKELLNTPRCGLPDIATSGFRNKRYSVTGQRWHHTNLTWSLPQHSNELRGLDQGRVRFILSKALDVWAQHSKLSFTEISGDRADIVVYFQKGYHGDGYPFDGRGQILAHAFFPGGGRGGDAHFDADENWLLDQYSMSEGTSLFHVAAHEFGHSLGLSHSGTEGALMYPWYQGMKPNFQLPEDDRLGIQMIYGTKEDKLWGTIPKYPNYPDREPPPREPPPRRPEYTTPSTTTTSRQPPRTRPQVPTRPPYPTRPTPRPPYKKPTKHPRFEKPDTCDTTYDAMSMIRGELFIFKGRYLWRVGSHGLASGYPAEIDRLWYIPRHATHIDAVYERPDKKIAFFIGKEYYLYQGNVLEPGYPQPITHLGLPATLEKIDGAMVWGHNKRTYFFSGTMYWRFDEDVGKVELDYPRDMSMWKGVGYDIDTVFQWKDAKTYFFKGKGYWKFNDLRMRVEHEKQKLSAPFWMGHTACPPELTNPIEDNMKDLLVTQSAAQALQASVMGIILTLSISYLFVRLGNA